MEKRLMTFIACLFLSLGMALAQTQVSGTITSSEDGSPVIGALSKLLVHKPVLLPMLTVISHWLLQQMPSWRFLTSV